jgi:ankyrin repeat protein
MSDYPDFHEAIMAGDVKALEEIAQFVDGFPPDWITDAIHCGTVKVVAWMLAHGAPAVFVADDGYSVLHCSIEREKPDKYEIMRMLIEAGADVNAKGINDWTPAHMAAVRNDVEALKILRVAGADFTIRTKIDNYATPLEEAVMLGSTPETVTYLKGLT